MHRLYLKNELIWQRFKEIVEDGFKQHEYYAFSMLGLEFKASGLCFWGDQSDREFAFYLMTRSGRDIVQWENFDEMLKWVGEQLNADVSLDEFHRVLKLRRRRVTRSPQPQYVVDESNTDPNVIAYKVEWK